MKLLPMALAFGCSGIVFLVACGGHPGGTVGDACDNVGSSSECASDEICDDIGSGDGAYCLRRCIEHSDCDASERCNGISGSNEKGCHPQSEDEPLDDCGKKGAGC